MQRQFRESSAAGVHPFCRQKLKSPAAVQTFGLPSTSLLKRLKTAPLVRLAFRQPDNLLSGGASENHHPLS
jgi:hypothetical protein